MQGVDMRDRARWIMRRYRYVKSIREFGDANELAVTAAVFNVRHYDVVDTCRYGWEQPSDSHRVLAARELHTHSICRAPKPRKAIEPIGPLRRWTFEPLEPKRRNRVEELKRSLVTQPPVAIGHQCNARSNCFSHGFKSTYGSGNLNQPRLAVGRCRHDAVKWHDLYATKACRNRVCRCLSKSSWRSLADAAVHSRVGGK